MEISIKENNFFVYKDEMNKQKKAKFSAPIKSSFGTWQLTSNSGVGNFIGSTITINIQDPDLVADNYNSGIKVALENKDAPFVNLTMSDVMPQRGKDVLNALMALYLDFAIQDKNKL